MGNPRQILNELLVDVFNHILDIEAEELKKAGVLLSIKEVHVLEAITRTEEKTMGNVAKQLRITVGSLTTSVDRLVSKGYVKRANDENDRRKVLIDLTSKATSVMQAHDDFHNQMLESLFCDINIDQEEVVIKSLENIKNFFKFKY